MKQQEIERKFIIENLPNIEYQNPIRDERYFLLLDTDVEWRIQKRDTRFSLKEKTRNSGLSNEKTKIEISANEFEQLKQHCTFSLERDIYCIKEGISLKVYQGTYEGLIRAEFEFDTEEAAAVFVPPDWCGVEITESILGRDSKLIGLSREEFLKELKRIQGK